MRAVLPLSLVFAIAGAAPTTFAAVGAFDLQVSTVGFSKAQRDAFAAAEVLWEDVIVSYAEGISRTSLPFTARKLGIDGPGGILGQSGPTGSTTEGGFVLSTGGTMIIDSADIDLLSGNNQLSDVIAHEIGHILGIGSLWVENGLYVNDSGQYTGAFGLNAYRQEFDSSAGFVPVELDGGQGTANGHWDELANVFDPTGRPLTEELMTGYLGNDPYLSQTTIQSLRDLGFEVVGLPGPILPGDYNEDGTVDSADYALWRSDPDSYGGAQGYTDWVSNFGQTAGSGAGASANAPVPEPESCLLLILGATFGIFMVRRAASRVPTIR